jgi:hypothetical protein
MPLYKSSQLMDAHDDFENFGDEDEVVLYDERPSKEDVIEMHEPKGELEISFKLPPLPGSDADIPLEVSTDDEIEVKDKNDLEENKELEVKDPSDYRSYSPRDLSQWAHYMFQNIPRHTGRETTGIERCISYLKKFDADLSRAISSDFKGEADIGKLEEARKELYDGIDRLEDALEKLKSGRKKKSDLNAELVKEAQKATHVGGIIITVPIFISRLARICINSQVSAGKDIEDIYGKLVKKYALTEREQAELMQILSDMNYPLRQDRGYNTDELVDETSSDNFDWSAQFPS